MKALEPGKAVVFASKYTQNHHPPVDTLPGTKFGAARVEPGGAGVVAARVLQRLGRQVVLMGRRTPALASFLELTAAEGIVSHLLPVEGPEAANVILPGCRILRVARGPTCSPTSEEGIGLGELWPRAIALGGSMDNDYAAFLAEFATAAGIWFFWNPNPNADLGVIDGCGPCVLQVSFAEFANGAASEAALARQLLAQSAATVVCVTNAERGAIAVERESPHAVLHAPAISIPSPVREVGAGDAHFAGFIAMFLDARPVIRLERSLSVARLVAARYVSGHAPGDWTDLAQYQAHMDQVPEVREAA